MENKPIWTVFDTDGLLSYFNNNPDMVIEAFPVDDDEEISDEQWQGAINWLVERSTDGRLAQMLNDTLFDTWLGEKFNDLLWDVLTDYMWDEVGEYAKQLKED